MTHFVSIVGRPNVGKSALFNRLVGRRAALVHDQPGVTRDRKIAAATVGGVEIELCDTGGLAGDEDAITSGVAAQVESAIRESAVLIFVCDGRGGVTPQDSTIAGLLRPHGKPIVLAVNKMDHVAVEETDLPQFYELGLGDPIPVSAEHNRGFDGLKAAIRAALPACTDAGSEIPDSECRMPNAELRTAAPIRLAVVGRPNAGKSTLVNRLLGCERMLVTDVPGTTRDAVDSPLETGDGRYVLIDTAGIRRRRSIDADVEKLCVSQAFDAIGRCDVVLMVLDATGPVTEQDARIAGHAHERGRGMVLLANKWDAARRTGTWRDARHYEGELRHSLKYLAYAQVLVLSARTGEGTDAILPEARRVFASYTRRVSTPDLNRVVGAIQEDLPPPIYRSKRVKFYYAAQTGIRPPRFTFVANHPEGVHFSYRRHVVNALREAFGFCGVPVEVAFKPRKRTRR
ncbi:MAG: ribosome biogenesis GTPase Der [Deltaproteobacteria bacterium]|nr:ribosome biogenesis GTPase Der [Deltaproteobacteria bacterium]